MRKLKKMKLKIKQYLFELNEFKSQFTYSLLTCNTNLYNIYLFIFLFFLRFIFLLAISRTIKLIIYTYNDLPVTVKTTEKKTNNYK